MVITNNVWPYILVLLLTTFHLGQVFHMHNINDKFLGFRLCPELSILNGDVEYDVDRPREPYTKATYSCREGYTLEGESPRTCGREGKWLGEEPKCKATHYLL